MYIHFNIFSYGHLLCHVSYNDSIVICILFVLYFVPGGVVGLAYTLKDYRHCSFSAKVRNEVIAQYLSKGEALTLKTKFSGARDWTGFELIGKSYVIAIY